MANWIEGVDVSRWQGEVSVQQWRQLRGAGQQVACVGSWHGMNKNEYCEASLRNAEEAGFTRLGTYMALSPAYSGIYAIRQGKEACGAMWEKVSWASVDCEIDGITRQAIIDALHELSIEGKPRCIYTAYWWWHDHFGNSDEFKHEPLWNAYYDADRDIDFMSAPYGGWTIDKVIGEQYAGTVSLAGVTVDRNTFREDFAKEGVDVTQEEVTHLRALNQAAEFFAHMAEKAARGEAPTAAEQRQLVFMATGR